MFYLRSDSLSAQCEGETDAFVVDLQGTTCTEVRASASTGNLLTTLLMAFINAVFLGSVVVLMGRVWAAEVAAKSPTSIVARGLRRISKRAASFRRRKASDKLVGGVALDQAADAEDGNGTEEQDGAVAAVSNPLNGGETSREASREADDEWSEDSDSGASSAAEPALALAAKEARRLAVELEGKSSKIAELELLQHASTAQYTADLAQVRAQAHKSAQALAQAQESVQALEQALAQAQAAGAVPRNSKRPPPPPPRRSGGDSGNGGGGGERGGGGGGGEGGGGGGSLGSSGGGVTSFEPRPYGALLPKDEGAAAASSAVAAEAGDDRRDALAVELATKELMLTQMIMNRARLEREVAAAKSVAGELSATRGALLQAHAPVVVRVAPAAREAPARWASLAEASAARVKAPSSALATGARAAEASIAGPGRSSTTVFRSLLARAEMAEEEMGGELEADDDESSEGGEDAIDIVEIDADGVRWHLDSVGGQRLQRHWRRRADAEGDVWFENRRSGETQ